MTAQSERLLPNPSRVGYTSLLLTLALVGILAYILVELRIADFQQAQRQLAQRAVQSTAVEIAKSIENTRHLTTLFATGEARLISQVAAHPDEADLHRQLETRLRAFIPEAINYTIADTSGTPLLSDPDKRVGKGCRRDIKAFANGNHINTIFVHSNPKPSGYHYDLLSGVHSADGFNGIFFISMNTDILTRLISRGQLEGHQLMLLRSDKDHLIDITQAGPSPVIHRARQLSEEEQARILYLETIPHSRWTLVDLPDADLFSNYRAQLLMDGLFIWLAFAAFSLLMFWLLRREESQRRLAEQALLDAHNGLEVRVRERTAELQASRDELSHQATHDSLTNLINRTEFERQLEHQLDLAHTEGVVSVLCYVDLDQFKLINDTCGHVAGDELLRQAADELKRHIRGGDSLGRLGGDEFGLIYSGCGLTKACELIGNMIRDFQEKRFTWDGRSFEITLSAGVVAINESLENHTAALSHADAACFAAKDLGRNRYYVNKSQDSEMQRRHRDMSWATRIPEALEQDRFVLYAQPIVPLDNTAASSHQEVLVRLLDIDGTLIPPGDFIPAAERYNLMNSIDRHVIAMAFENYSALNKQFPAEEPLQLSINLSGNSLRDDSLVKFIDEQRRKHDIPANYFTFEITETSAIGNLESARQLVAKLKLQGFYLALDDFGSGLSSFAYLKELPVDIVKIDGQFIRNITRNPVDHSMVSAIHQVAATMDIKTIAEFVENEDILNCLREIGINYAQGYGISRPAPLTSASPGEQRSRTPS